MESQFPLHEFDPDRARRYHPSPAFVKTAVLLQPVDPNARTELRTPFGEEVLEGAFYLVYSEDGSYGAARAEFEAAHERLGPTTWRGRMPVDAYQAEAAERVVTYIGDVAETEVVARPGDWIVRRATGEVMVLEPEGFEARYQADG